MTGAVGGVLRFGIGAVFKTGTTIGASEPRALGSTVLVFALEVSGLTPPVVGGFSVADVFGLAGKLEAFVGGAAEESGVVTLEFGAEVTTIGFVAGFSGLVGATSGFAGLMVTLELGFSMVFEICGLGAVARVRSFGGVLELGLVTALELGLVVVLELEGFAGPLEA